MDFSLVILALTSINEWPLEIISHPKRSQHDDFRMLIYGSLKLRYEIHFNRPLLSLVKLAIRENERKGYKIVLSPAPPPPGSRWSREPTGSRAYRVQSPPPHTSLCHNTLSSGSSPPTYSSLFGVRGGTRRWGTCLRTVINTQSSPWNLGMYESPRATSDLFSGLKRHITLMVHSAGFAILTAGHA